jgi:hypothetical protein
VNKRCLTLSIHQPTVSCLALMNNDNVNDAVNVLYSWDPYQRIWMPYKVPLSSSSPIVSTSVKAGSGIGEENHDSNAQDPSVACCCCCCCTAPGIF